MRWKTAGISLKTLKFPAMLLAIAFTAAAAASVGGRVWPPAPDKARIRLIAVLPEAAQEDNAGPLFLKILRRLAGLKPGKRRGPGFVRPTGVAVRGRVVYAADPGAGGVVIYDTEKRSCSLIPANRRNRLPSPVGVAAASDGSIFVSDSRLRKVLLFDAGGRASGELKPPPGAFMRPGGLALDEARGRLWVADAAAHMIYAYSLGGEYLFSIGARGQAPGSFNYPTYLWADTRTGALWVCDSGNFRVQSLDAAGRPTGALGRNGNCPGYLARPRGVAADSEGHVYVADGAMSAVQIFDESGRLLLYFGERGGQPGEFYLPGGVFIDGDDRIYVADTYNARVQVFQYLKDAP
ncbi:MAG: hypothetical protein M0025_12125 [Elusimicrobia bacterium]|nr:hypothetical protein [Elusimicrobiota bacterium]